MIELTRGFDSSGSAAAAAERFFATLAKRTVWVGDAPGLVLGRIVGQPRRGFWQRKRHRHRDDPWPSTTPRGPLGGSLSARPVGARRPVRRAHEERYKARELAANPRAALLFYWDPLADR